MDVSNEVSQVTVKSETQYFKLCLYFYFHPKLIREETLTNRNLTIIAEISAVTGACGWTRPSRTIVVRKRERKRDCLPLIQYSRQNDESFPIGMRSDGQNRMGESTHLTAISTPAWQSPCVEILYFFSSLGFGCCRLAILDSSTLHYTLLQNCRLPIPRFSMNSLLSQYVDSRNRVRYLSLDRDEALLAINRHVFSGKVVRHPFIFITMRQQVDALAYRKGIEHSFQPSSILIRTGGDEVELLDAVKGLRPGCRVRIASSPVRHRTTRDYRKYQSLYYAWRLSVEALEEQKRQFQHLYQRFQDVNVLKVSDREQLNILKDVKNSGGWTANDVVIPGIAAGLSRRSLQEDIVRSGFVLLLGNQ